MNSFDLLEIANNICTTANSKFAKRDKSFTCKWILLDEVDIRKKMKLLSVEQIDHTILYTIHSLKDDSIYIQLIEYITNIESIQNMLSYYGNFNVIPKHKEEATDDIREKGERG